MIQRRQSIYLLIIGIVVLLLALGDFTFYTEKGTLPNEEGTQVIEIQYDEYSINQERIDSLLLLQMILLVSGALSLVIIFLYKSRKTQANMTRLLIALLFSNLVFMYWFTYPMDYLLDGVGHMNYLSLPPFACLILSILALRGIKKDEALVRSIDRIR